MTEELIKIYSRDLSRLKEEVEAFRAESNLWKITGGIINPAGNLCLHLVGNLKTFVGRNMGNYPYVRDREAEFHLQNVPKQKLIAEVEETKEVVLNTLRNMTKMQLEAHHPEDVFGYEMTNAFFLIHLATHLSYHLGQINYLRRILE